MSSVPLYSSSANDEDMAELLAIFVEELPQRITEIETAHRSGNLQQLKTYAHQLKGSAGSYGFQLITDVAGQLEKDLNSAHRQAQVNEGVKSLVGLLRRATASANPELQG
ncbi:MAG: Hpt domain-containing protein [Planctomycetota bacterium]